MLVAWIGNAAVVESPRGGKVAAGVAIVVVGIRAVVAPAAHVRQQQQPQS